jgi:hypothetical protein
LRQFLLRAVKVTLQRFDQLADIAASAGHGRAQLLLQIACRYTRVAA